MKRPLIFVCLFFVSVLGFAQESSFARITGRIPAATEESFYQIQVGAFKLAANAEWAFEQLKNASLNPVYETYLDFTRVIAVGIKAAAVPECLEKIKNAGFTDVYIKIDPNDYLSVELPVAEAPPVELPVPVSIAELPVSTAALPTVELCEIGYRSLRVGETKSLADIASDREVASWISSTPSTVRVDSSGNITGLKIGNGYITINETEYISIVVVPSESFYLVPESEAALLPPDSRTSDSSTENLNEYRTEPTFRLAYRFNNRGERRGASGTNGGIDVLGRGPDYEWLWTTYCQGGWFYDLNGVKREMVDGRQTDANNGVVLNVKPEFVYDDGVPYLQLRHMLHNPNSFAVTGQKFGASADVMIHQNDDAPLVYTDYGAYMTDSQTAPSLELMFVCVSGNGITPIDTLWLGGYYGGRHLDYIYDDSRSNVRDIDSAIGFSYRNIELAPMQTKEFIVRFTLARTEDD